MECQRIVFNLQRCQHMTGRTPPPKKKKQKTKKKKTKKTTTKKQTLSLSKISRLIYDCLRPTAQRVKTDNIDKPFLQDDVLNRQVTIDDQSCDQLAVPRQLYRDFFQLYYDGLGLQGRDRTLSLMKKIFFWPGMTSVVTTKIQKCGRCIRPKILPKQTANFGRITTTAPIELVCIDYLKLDWSKGWYDNILVITDHFTRYACAIPTRN